MNITLIGDAHGKVSSLQQVHKLNCRTIQLGDVGFGFHDIPTFAPQHEFIRGNHDDPAKAREHKNYLGDFGYLPEASIFYVSGAYSIDYAWRVPGRSWWPDEELSIGELNQAVQAYEAAKPNIVISHDCPTKANISLLTGLMGPYFSAKGGCQTSRTCQALQSMFEIHKPKLWVFGHYHVTKNFVLDGTEFQCLAELDTRTIETGDFQ